MQKTYLYPLDFALIFGDLGDPDDPAVQLLNRPYVQMELLSAVQAHYAVDVRKISTHWQLLYNVMHLTGYI